MMEGEVGWQQWLPTCGQNAWVCGERAKVTAGGGVVGKLEVNPKAEGGGKMEGGGFVAVENFQQPRRLVASGGAKFGRARTFGAGRR